MGHSRYSGATRAANSITDHLLGYVSGVTRPVGKPSIVNDVTVHEPNEPPTTTSNIQSTFSDHRSPCHPKLYLQVEM